MLVRFSKKKEKPAYQSLSKFVQWASSCSMGTERETDMTKLIVAFRNFAKTPNNTESVVMEE